MLKRIFLFTAQAMAHKHTTIATAFIGVFLSIHPVYAGDRILSYRQFVEEMVAETDSVYQLTNAVIRLDPDTDHHFSTTAGSQVSGAAPSPLVIDKAVRLTHVRFEGSAYFRNLRFHKKLSLESVSGDPWLTFDSCDFFADVVLSNVEPWIYFKNSRFHRNISHFNRRHPVKLKIVGSDFLPSKFADAGEQSHGDNYRLTAAGFNQVGSYFEVWNTAFPWTSDRDKVILWGDHGVVSILGNTFDIPLILGAKIASGFDFYDNQINKLVSFEHLLFSTDVAVAPWEQFAGHKLAIGGGPNNPHFYQARSDEELLETTRYTLLKAAYSRLLNIYSSFGDNQSYNGCYVELKNLETRRLLLILEGDADFTVLFRYLLNVFLKLFSNYGTSPALALVFSLKVIFAFTVVYFFVPNSWPTSGRDQLLLQLRRIITLFRRREGVMVSLQNEVSVEHHLKDYQAFLSELHTSRDQIPTFFRVLAPQIYLLALVGERARQWVYGHLDIFQAPWFSMTRSKQTIFSVLLALYIASYLLGHLLLRILDAFIVSLNAFSTLGFGGIPFHGVARYVVVCEGLVGWLMLTIFSVSLIGQLLR
jgi:hypothetical protein